MHGRTLCAVCAGFVAGCAGPAELPTIPLPFVEQAAAEISAEIVTVELVALAAPQPDVVCRDRTRPGSRIVVGQDCRPRVQTSVSPDALRELDRELKRRGYTQGDARDPLGAN